MTQKQKILEAITVKRNPSQDITDRSGGNKESSSTITKIDDNTIRHIAPREEINDLIGNAPGWLLQSGISLVFFITLLLFGMSHMVSYPDKILATGIVTTENPPIQLLAPRVVRIKRLLVENRSKVEVGDRLIHFNCTANEQDIETLIDWINNYKEGQNVTSIPYQLSLGTLQPLYAQLQLVYNEYQQTRRQLGVKSQLETIDEEIKNIARLNRSIQIEEEYLSHEETLSRKELERAKRLLEEGLISMQEYENGESKYTALLRQSEVTNKNIIQNDIRKNQLILESKKLTEERHSTLLQYQFRINELLTQFSAEHLNWVENNYLHAEISGALEYNTDITSQYTLQAGQSIGYIIPKSNNNNKHISARIASEGIGKVLTDSRAIIKFDAYPHKEYGVIEVNTNFLSSIPSTDAEGNSAYDLRIPLTADFVTNYNKKIPYRPEMIVSIELITSNRSVLERILEQIVDALQ